VVRGLEDDLRPEHAGAEHGEVLHEVSFLKRFVARTGGYQVQRATIGRCSAM
jgi:hypothetical protein